MIYTKNLSFAYENNLSFEFPDLSCKSGETLLILGNSGTGKTTLLHLLGLILESKSGEISIDNQNVAKINSKNKATFRANNIGIIYQRPHFINSLNLKDNLLIANYLSGKKLDYARAEYLAQSLGIPKKLNEKIQNLSGGELQRVGIARALMNRPKVLLADEPTSALDDTNCKIAIDLLQNAATEINAALLIVTHDTRLKSIFKTSIILD